MLSPRRQTLLIAFGLFIVLAGLAIYASPLSARSLEARLQTAAEAALYDIRADEWASLEMNGQVAILSGRAPNRQARDSALEAVRTAAWAGGVVAGGVTKVVDLTRLPASDAVFGLHADLIGGRLTLTGFAPDAEGRDRIEQAARRLFSERVDIRLQLAPGGAPEGWEATVRLMLSELARLDAGAAVMRGDRVALTGLAGNAQTADLIRAAFDDPPEGFAAAALVRPAGAAYESRITDAPLCELAITAALGRRAVAFSPGGVGIGEQSRAALRRAGEAFARCEDLVLTVRVRVAEGADAETLAIRRAAAIADALAAGGADRMLIETATAPREEERALAFEVNAPNPDPGVEEDDGADQETEPESQALNDDGGD
ncbi:hypothetical protein DDZ18_07090 [Marinicauda salina]|uniref:BON domain-containing protein n=1 Tax=Marinicauda salina TaxID=2135793 RepID=A0A2U2BTU3_9PROT|nr:BON domain-containing protein [Marinicauda salina]PWE17438.1 hypothetical protein DDZ18_07090 [Marinicauda salina]